MKRIITLTGVLAAAAAMSGCALVDRFTDRFSKTEVADAGEAVEIAELAEVADPPGQIEPVHAAAIVQDQAVFWVSSNGCTQKSDLTPVVRRAGDASVITLRRIKVDRCLEPLAEGVEMRWSFQEMGLAPGSQVSVENPYQLPPG